jgi:hypothetical protein
MVSTISFQHGNRCRMTTKVRAAKTARLQASNQKRLGQVKY